MNIKKLNITIKNLQGCPIFYKIPINDKTFKNEYGFVAYEFDQNSYSAPKFRTLLEIIITENESSTDKDNFAIKSKKICDNFIEHHLEYIKSQIQYKLNNIDILDEESKKYIQANENLHTEVQLLAKFRFLREINNHDYSNLDKDLIITKNNYTENDIDFYYEEAGKIMKENKWDILEPIELQSNFQSSVEEPDQTENLIDELFDSIDVNK